MTTIERAEKALKLADKLADRFNTPDCVFIAIYKSLAEIKKERKLNKNKNKEIMQIVDEIVSIPFYAYGDNEAACKMMDAMKKIGTIALSD